MWKKSNQTTVMFQVDFLHRKTVNITAVVFVPNIEYARLHPKF